MMRLKLSLTLLILLLAACTSSPTESEPVRTATSTQPASPIAEQTSKPPPTQTAAPTETAVPPTATPDPTPTTEPTDEPVPEPTAVSYTELIPIGAMANLTDTNDPIGIEGTVEILSETQLRLSDFLFLAAEAPGVDIRLGVDNQFQDGVGVSLKDITGDTYEGRSLTLTIPDEAFNGRSFNSIGIFCFDTGDLFDHALFANP